MYIQNENKKKRRLVFNEWTHAMKKKKKKKKKTCKRKNNLHKNMYMSIHTHISNIKYV